MFDTCGDPNPPFKEPPSGEAHVLADMDCAMGMPDRSVGRGELQRLIPNTVAFGLAAAGLMEWLGDTPARGVTELLKRPRGVTGWLCVLAWRDMVVQGCCAISSSVIRCEGSAIKMLAIKSFASSDNDLGRT